MKSTQRNFTLNWQDGNVTLFLSNIDRKKRRKAYSRTCLQSNIIFREIKFNNVQ